MGELGRCTSPPICFEHKRCGLQQTEPAWDAQAKWKAVNRHFPGPPNAAQGSPGNDGVSSRPEDGWGGYEQADGDNEQDMRP